MLIQLDRFLHERVFNPLALRMQAKFHVNRYHLLVVFGVLSILLNVIVMFIGSVAEAVTKHSVIDGLTAVSTFVGIAILFSTGLVTNYLSALLEAARRFEERGFIVQPTALIHHAITCVMVRPYANVVVLALPLFALNEALGWLLVQLGGPAQPLTALHIGRLAFAFCFVFEIHLWDAQDLDPRDREYHKQLQKSTS